MYASWFSFSSLCQLFVFLITEERYNALDVLFSQQILLGFVNELDLVLYSEYIRQQDMV